MRLNRRTGLVSPALLAISAIGGLSGTYSLVAWGGAGTVPSPNTGFTSASVSTSHGLALKADGTVVSWGGNADGQGNVPAGLTGAVGIEAGNRYSLAVDSAGQIWAWGYNGNGQLNVPSPNSGFIAISAGWTHGVGLKSTGQVVCWGWGGVGQTSISSQNNKNFIKVATMTYHNVGLKSNGSVFCWGRNLAGECNNPASRLRKKDGETGFVDVAAGGYYPDPISGGPIEGFSVALTNKGRVVVWGSDLYGLVSTAPTGNGFVAIAAGLNHAMALRQDGTVVCWGAGTTNAGTYPHYGQSMVPSGLPSISKIEAGGMVSMGLVSEISPMLALRSTAQKSDSSASRVIPGHSIAVASQLSSRRKF